MNLFSAGKTSLSKQKPPNCAAPIRGVQKQEAKTKAARGARAQEETKGKLPPAPWSLQCKPSPKPTEKSLSQGQGAKKPGDGCASPSYREPQVKVKPALPPPPAHTHTEEEPEPNRTRSRRGSRSRGMGDWLPNARIRSHPSRPFPPRFPPTATLSRRGRYRPPRLVAYSRTTPKARRARSMVIPQAAAVSAELSGTHLRILPTASGVADFFILRPGNSVKWARNCPPACRVPGATIRILPLPVPSHGLSLAARAAGPIGDRDAT